MLSVLVITGTASAESLFSSAHVVSDGVNDYHSTSDSSLVTATGTAPLFEGTASAQADFGALHAAAHASSAGVVNFSYSQGYASFGDDIVIGGGTGTGSYLVDYTVSGSRTSTGSPQINANVLWDNLPNGVNGGLTDGTHTYMGAYPVAFTYGVPFHIGATLTLSVSFYGGATGDATLDFSHTATLSAIHVLDGTGHEVFGRSISAASGTVYPQPVPEPVSLATLGLGLALLTRRRNAR